VILFPVNAYTTETIQRKYEKGEKLAEGDSRYYQYLRVTRADREGNFVFRQIPAGDYYVGTDVGWSCWNWDTDSDGSLYKMTIHRSSRIYARISVGEGQAGRVTRWSQGKSRLLNGVSDS